MKDIHEVLRRKQAKYAQLGKQIEMLQQVAEKLREVAPLLADNDEDESAILAELEEPLSEVIPAPKAAAAAPASNGPSVNSGQPAPAKARSVSPRWP